MVLGEQGNAYYYLWGKLRKQKPECQGNRKTKSMFGNTDNPNSDLGGQTNKRIKVSGTKGKYRLGRASEYRCFVVFFLSKLEYFHYSNEPGHEKMYLMPYANNKGADQPAHPRSLISAFVVRFQDRMIPLVYIPEISRF